nr:tetratricopeptide repeat protein [Myxococcota bacterium]
GRASTRSGAEGSSAPASSSERPQIASTFGRSSAPRSAPAATSGPRTFDQLRGDARDAFQARRYDDAARAYEQASRMRPRDASVWAGLGAARMQGGDARAAIDAYRRAVSIEPRNVRYHVSIGRAFAAAGDRARARQAFEHALQLDPNNRDARTQLGRL